VKGNTCCKVNIALALSGVANDEEPMYPTVYSHVSKSMSRVFRKCMNIAGGVWVCKSKFPVV